MSAAVASARALLAGVCALAMAACGRPDARHSDSSRARAGAVAPPAETEAWVVSDSGAGPLRVGMTLGEAAKALGVTAPDTSREDPACEYPVFDRVPAGVRLMWVDGRLTRVDVDSASIATDRGARVGDAATSIESMYNGRVSSQPHKYDPHGSYLVVRAPAAGDTSLRIVFETDSARHVTRFRAGRVPAVEWVEGCA